jgi:hypothetical protein
MGRTLPSVACLALSAALAREASAVPVASVDLDAFAPGSPISSHIDVLNPFGSYTVAGLLQSGVFLDGPTYIYTQTVTSFGGFNLLFSTEFEVLGFTGVAGWSFSSAGAVGATGTASDFNIQAVDGRLSWLAMPGGALGEWNAFEPITFFFASTARPTIKSYDLLSLSPFSLGRVDGLAPLPEPGSLALFGSGLVGLYAALRRRRATTP